MIADWLQALREHTTSIALIALAVACLAALAVAIALVALRRLRELQRHSAALGRELAAFVDASIGMGRTLDRAASGLPRRTALASPAKDGPTQRAMDTGSNERLGAPPAAIGNSDDRAVQLARGGASIDDLVAACALSRSEASLVLALARRDRLALVR